MKQGASTCLTLSETLNCQQSSS